MVFNQVMIIAEAGVNHNGDLEMAKRLIDVASEAGADVVKFQTAKLDSLVSKCAMMAAYQEENIGVKRSQKDMLASLLLSFEDFVILANYCEEKNIQFLSTPFDIESIHFLENMVPFWKIPSGEITNYPYLKEIGMTKKPVVLSTGMCTIDEIEDAISILKEYGTTDITLLHCTTEYPADVSGVNLNAIAMMKEQFGLQVGYSDHTEGIFIPVAAVAMGACVIEKHFTLDKSLPGPDHIASINPKELQQLVRDIRNTEKAMGAAEKIPTEKELNNRLAARKSIVAASQIKKGDVFTEINLTTKRPGTGISPMKWHKLIGKVAKQNYDEDMVIEVGELDV